MALRGDIPEGAKVRDFRYASDLAEFLRKERPKLNIAGACYPEGHNEAISRFSDIKNLKKKINAGVTHLNSQLFFDNEDFFEFCDLIDLAGIEVPVQAGIMPIVKLNQVNRVISMTGVKIPSKLSRLLSRYGQDENALMDAGIAYATEQISDLIAGGVRGIHLYIMNNVYVATRITENIKSLLQRANEQQ
jgi:methylenetetrahydrofolate reductase (NADPH)